MSTTPAGPDDRPRSRSWLIVVVAVVVFCCLCALTSALVWSLYTYGDQLFGLSALPSGVLI